MTEREIDAIFNTKIDQESWRIGEALLQGILLEVSSYPKPGLVSSISAGAHRDMNILTFMASSAAIAPAFVQCAQAGRNHSGSLPELLPVLRNIGIRYEKRLLQATRGVNTQRGILFAGGMLCGVAGYLSRRSRDLRTSEMFPLVAEMTRGLVAKELKNLPAGGKDKYTAGEMLYLRYQTEGIRGEVEKGFPSVRKKGLPALEAALRKGLTLNSCLVHTLVSLMTCVEDTTILWRKDKETLLAVQEQARKALEKGSVFTKEGLAEIVKMDKSYIRDNISPGGSADLVAITVGSYLLEHQEFPVPIF